MRLASILRCHEHFSQRDVAVSQIAKAQRTDHFVVHDRDPKVPSARLIEMGNGGKVGLIVRRDRDFELTALNPDDQIRDARGVAVFERTYVHFGKSKRWLTF